MDVGRNNIRKPFQAHLLHPFQNGGKDSGRPGFNQDASPLRDKVNGKKITPARQVHFKTVKRFGDGFYFQSPLLHSITLLEFILLFGMVSILPNVNNIYVP
jgi:hypothetical protein